jgi:hypothetical protein
MMKDRTHCEIHSVPLRITFDDHGEIVIELYLVHETFHKVLWSV